MVAVQDKPSAIDLFCGAGGLSQGFQNAGFKILAANDSWKIALKTFEMNHKDVKIIHADITKEETQQKIIEAANHNVDVIIGGPPCQAYSLAGKRDPDDPRGKLFYSYVKLVKEIQPSMFVMENVKGILTMKHVREDIGEDLEKEVVQALRQLFKLDEVGKKRRAVQMYKLESNSKVPNPEEQRLQEFVKQYLVPVPEAIKQSFSKIGYSVDMQLLNAADYGVPQERERVFFIGARKDKKIPIPILRPTHSKNPKVDLPTGRRRNKWVTLKKAIGDLPDPCKSTDDEVYEGGFSSIYMSRNRRKDWGDASYTIQAGARHAPLHPSSPRMKKVETDKWVFTSEKGVRRLSVRECAKIQTFPDTYKFASTVLDKYTQIGNAVPPLLAQRVAEAVMESLEKICKT
jgi:DNA (cytosine-5)-methyltransferase 1